ncbi:hypothetical protein NMT52_25930, partial [Escherichia coli]|nr:hypothetical protein [Escherichia coli]
FIALGILAGVTTFASLWLWPKDDPVEVPHTHGDLKEGDEHLQSPAVDDARQHSHAYVIDDQHQRWPRS